MWGFDVDLPWSFSAVEIDEALERRHSVLRQLWGFQALDVVVPGMLLQALLAAEAELQWVVGADAEGGLRQGFAL